MIFPLLVVVNTASRPLLSTSNTELGYALANPIRAKFSFRNPFTVVTNSSGTLQFSVAIPPNLPTQEVESHEVTFEGAIVISKFEVEVTPGGQRVEVFTVRPTSKDIVVRSIDTATLYRQTDGLAQVTKFPNFTSMGDKGPLDYTKPTFVDWITSKGLLHTEGQAWGDYFATIYPTLDKQWNYGAAKIVGDDGTKPIPGVRVGKGITCSNIITSRTAACEDMAVFMAGLMRYQEVPTVRLAGAVVWPNKIGLHNIIASNLPGGGWRLIDATPAISGDHRAGIDGYFFAHHAIEGVETVNPTTGKRFTISAPMMAEVAWQFTPGDEVHKNGDSTLGYRKL